MPAAARMNDKVKQDTPHCHAVHGPSTPPVPIAHPGLPLGIVGNCVPTVMIEGQQAATVGSISEPCKLPGCTPAGPGVITKGSATVFIGGRPAARVNDLSAHASCVATIPSPLGKVMPPGSTKVNIGG